MTETDAIEILLEAAKRHHLLPEAVARFGDRREEGQPTRRAAFGAAIDLGIEDTVTSVGRERQGQQAQQQMRDAMKQLF